MQVGFRAVGLALATAIAAVSPSGELQAQTIEQLRAKYPWGALYVTSSPLVDLKYLAASDKGAQLQSDPGFLPLRTFIEQVGRSAITRNIAFLHIDLRELRAGYSSPTNQVGLLTQLPWSPDQVVAVARWLDRYITTNQVFASRVELPGDAATYADSVTAVAGAWTAVMQAVGDPLVSPARALNLAIELRAELAATPDLLARVYSTDPELYATISNFQQRIDRLNYRPGQTDPLAVELQAQFLRPDLIEGTVVDLGPQVEQMQEALGEIQEGVG